MTQVLTLLIEEVSRFSGVVWKGIELSIRLNYELMSMLITLSSRCVKLLFLFLEKATCVPGALLDDVTFFLIDVGHIVISMHKLLMNIINGFFNFFSILVLKLFNIIQYIYMIVLYISTFLLEYVKNFIFKVIDVFLLARNSIEFTLSSILTLPSSVYNGVVVLYYKAIYFDMAMCLSYFDNVKNFVCTSIEFLLKGIKTSIKEYSLTTISSFLLFLLLWFSHKYFTGAFRRHVLLVSFYIFMFFQSAKHHMYQWVRYYWLRCFRNYETIDDDGELPHENGINQNENNFNHDGVNNRTTSDILRRPSLPRQKPKRYNRYALKKIDDDSDSDENFCVVCEDRKKVLVLFPCRHLCLCYPCYSKVKACNNLCPLCRIYIRDVLKIYS